MNISNNEGLGHDPTDEGSVSSVGSGSPYEGRPTGRARIMMIELVDNRLVSRRLLRKICTGDDAPSDERGDLCAALSVGTTRLFEDERLKAEVYRTHCAHLENACQGTSQRSIEELRRLFAQLCVAVVVILEVIEREIGHCDVWGGPDDDGQDLLMGSSPKNESSVIARYALTDPDDEMLKQSDVVLVNGNT